MVAASAHAVSPHMTDELRLRSTAACMAAIQFLEVQIRILAKKIEHRLGGARSRWSGQTGRWAHRESNQALE